MRKDGKWNGAYEHMSEWQKKKEFNLNYSKSKNNLDNSSVIIIDKTNKLILQKFNSQFVKATQ